MDILTVEELFEYSDKVESINLIGHEYILENPLEINSSVYITGNSAVIIGEIIVSGKVTFNDVLFEGKESVVFLENSSEATFNFCNFSGNNQQCAIYMVPNSKSKIDISWCKFKNHNVAINLNESNKISSLMDSQFFSCKTVIDNVGYESVLNYNNISNNNHYFNDQDIFAKIYQGYKAKESIFYICTKLSHLNNYARVKGYGAYDSIDTSNVIANNETELFEILKVCNKCKNIFLANCNYVSPIVIEKPISLIGDENTRIKPNFAYSEKVGIIIKSSYVVMDNIIIDGGKCYGFRYGIKCEIENISYVEMRNLIITNILDNGIVIDSKWSKAVVIENCIITNIKNYSALYGVGAMSIIGNTFTNSNVAISLRGSSKIYLRNNSINLCNVAIDCSEKLVDKLEILNCKFKTEKVLMKS